MDHKDLAQNLVKTCLRKGADAAEVYLESGRSLSIEVRKGEVETVQEAAGGGAGVRVFVGGRLGFASSNDLSEAALETTAAQAVAFARITTADEANVLPDDKGASDVAGLHDPEIARVPMDRKIALAREVEAAAMKDPRITTSDGGRYGESEDEIVLASSRGLLKSYRSSACSLGVSVVAEKGGQKSSGGEGCSRRFFAELKTPAEIAAKAVADAAEMLDPRMVKTQRVPVIFDADVARTLLGGILGAIDGESVLQGASFLAGRLDQAIAVEGLTIVDDGLLPRGLGSAPFDGEGVPTQKRMIVEKGRLRGFLYNTIVAKRAGVRSTGNASRGGFTALPGIGPHNFYMLAGPAKVEDILRETKRGLWLKEVTGYGINPVSGHFSGGAGGFWIEDGKVAFPVKGLTVAGTADEMLNGIDLVADDLDLNRGLAAPTFRIRELQIGGE